MFRQQHVTIQDHLDQLRLQEQETILQLNTWRRQQSLPRQLPGSPLGEGTSPGTSA